MHGIYNNRGENPISSVHPYPLILDLILDRGNNIWRRKRRDLLAHRILLHRRHTRDSWIFENAYFRWCYYYSRGAFDSILSGSVVDV